jgi:HD-like signal output (HDOD) protein
MLDYFIRRKLESITRLPSIPFVITEVLNALDDEKAKTSSVAELIESDQALTARVLRVANSPFYGFSRRISTVELAIVLIGTNSIKEIVISLILQRFFSKVRSSVLNIGSFWHYSIFCGACARLIARKVGYRLAGEAFVAGVMHDIGILIMSEYFAPQFEKIRALQSALNFSLIDAEKTIMNSTHCDIGAWLAEKWKLPDQLVSAIKNHHSSADGEEITENELQNKNGNSQIIKPVETLTAIVGISEWLATEMGFKDWALENYSSKLYIPQEMLDKIKIHDIIHPDSQLELLKNEILEEYNRASVLSELPEKPLY